MRIKSIASLMTATMVLSIAPAVGASADTTTTSNNATPDVNTITTNNASTVSDDNALVPYADSSLTNLGNSTPADNYHQTRVNHPAGSTTPEHYSTTPDSSQNNVMHTLFFLPKGFNVDPRQHGNYQSVVVTKDNIYLLESMGSGTNRGDIIKMKVSDLKQLGLDQPDKIDQIAEAYAFYCPFTTDGANHVNNLSDPDAILNKWQQQVTADQHQINASKAVLKEVVTKQNQTNTSLKYWQKTLNHINNVLNHDQKAKAKKPAAKANLKASLALDKKIKKHASDEINHEQDWQNKYNDRKQAVQNNLQSEQTSFNNELTNMKSLVPKLDLYRQIIKRFKVTSLMNIGHGQTLSYNPADQSLYLALDDGSSDNYNDVVKLNPETLQVEKQYHFLMQHGNGYDHIHTLTFDNDGNAYVGRTLTYGKDGNKYIIFKGHFGDNSVSFQPEQQIINRTNPTNQYVSYDAANNRLYIVSNDVLTSVPLDKLNEGSLTPSDVHYITFNSNREFEGLSFDQGGNGYQLILWSPELMEYDQPLD